MSVRYGYDANNKAVTTFKKEPLHWFAADTKYETIRPSPLQSIWMCSFEIILLNILHTHALTH